MSVTPAQIRARIGTDLVDGALNGIISDASQAIIARWGPDRDDDNPLSVSVEGRRRIIDLARPIDVGEDVLVTEFSERGFVDSSSNELVVDEDFRIKNGGRTIERLGFGAFTPSRYGWWDRVEVEYIPVDDQDQRDEAIIKLAILAVQYEGVSTKKVGDVTLDHRTYGNEREAIIVSLNPRPGLLLV